MSLLKGGVTDCIEKMAEVNLELGSGGQGVGKKTEEEMMASHLGIFDPPMVESGTIDKRECIYPPTQSIASGGPFTFIIPGEMGYYIDPSTIRVRGSFKVQKIVNGAPTDLADGADDEKVSVVNNIGASLFDGVNVDFNGHNVTINSTVNSHYKAYIEAIGSYGKDAVDTHLLASGFLMDEGDFDKADNAGAKKRMKWIKKSQKVAFSSMLQSDVLNCGKILLDDMNVTISLTRNKDSFLLHKKADDQVVYKLVILDLELRLVKVRLNSRIASEINSKLASGQRAQYHLTRTAIKSFTVPSGSTSLALNNVIAGAMPQQLIAGLVDQDAVNGNQEKNGFNFENYKVNDFYFLVNNQEMPSGHYKPDWASLAYRKEFALFYEQILGGNMNTGTQITEENYKKGCTLYAVDLTPDSCSAYHNHDMDRGSVSIYGGFSGATTKNLTLILYASYNDTIEIDNERNVYKVRQI